MNIIVTLFMIYINSTDKFINCGFKCYFTLHTIKRNKIYCKQNTSPIVLVSSA